MLTQINSARASLADFRKTRERLKRFTFGRQWDDLMVTPRGDMLSEGDYAARNGRVPLTNNMIHRLVKTLVGHFRNTLDPSEPDPLNRLNELDARMMEEFLISGCAVQRIVAERRPGRETQEVWVDNISPENFFCYPLRDPRAADVELIGVYHDWTLAETMARFAGGSKARASSLRNILLPHSTGAQGFEHCRIIEAWHREAVETLRCHDQMNATIFSIPLAREGEIAAINRKRVRRGKPRIDSRYEITTSWVGRYMTPDGTVVHTVSAANHPFAVKFYPLLDGEIHSFVSSIIDQQKYVNRLITLIDNIMSTSAKGVLLFPQDELPEGLTWRDVANRWASYDGIIPYLPKAGSPGPRQIVTNASNCGAYELLNLEMKLFDQISGVSNALQGENTSTNSAQLFDAQTRNSLVAISDIFASFNDFRDRRDEKIKALK